MKRKVYLFAMVVAMLMPALATAQDELTVADSTATNQYVPFYGYYADYGFRNEFVYPAEMLEQMMGGYITGLRFYSSSTLQAYTLPVVVRVKELATLPTMTLSSAWLATASDPAVWTGTCSIVDGEWNIEFDDVLEYQGGNLLISVVNTAAGTNSPTCYFYGINYQQGISAYAQGSAAASSATPSYILSFLPKCTFSYLPAGTAICRRPAALSVSDITPDGATIGWTAQGSESQWVVTLGGEEEIVVSTPYYTFTGLERSTDYEVTVRALCGQYDTSNAISTSFRTTCDMLTQDDLPLVENFDSYSYGGSIAPCWNRIDLYTSSAYDYPFILTGNDHTTGNGMRLYFYNGSATQINYLVLPPVDDLNGLMLNFWANVSNPSSFQFQVGTMTDPYDASTFTSFYTTPTSLTATLWVEIEAVVPEGTTAHYLAIRGSGAAQAAGNLDDVTLLRTPACPHPISVSVSDVDAVSATVSIVPSTGAESYIVVLKNGSTTVETYETEETELQLTSLTPGTVYTVEAYAVCNDGNPTNFVAARFTTACDILSQADLPLVENFENYGTGAINPCWTRRGYTSTSGTFYPSTSTTHNHSIGGSRSLYFYNGSGNYASMVGYAILPQVEDLNGLVLSFYSYYAATGDFQFQVGTMADSTDTASFNLIYASPADTTAETWIYNEVVIPEGTTAQYLAIRASGSAGQGAYLDDVTLMWVASCERPDGVSMSDVETDHAMVNIDDPHETGNYGIVLKQGETVMETYESTETEMEISGLEASTTYIVEVYSICDDGNPTNSVSVSFTTPCESLTQSDMPLVENFDSYTQYGEIDPCWGRLDYVVGGLHSYPAPYGNGDHTTTIGMRMSFYNGGGTQVNYLVLPPVDDLNGLMLDFWSKIDAPLSFQFQVGTMTDPTDSATFHLIYTTPTDLEANTWTEHDVVIPAGTTARYVAIRGHGEAYALGYIDDVTLTFAPLCVHPTGVSVSDIEAESATVSIDDPAAMGYYFVTIKADTVVVATYETADTAVQLTELTPGTAYTVEAQTICASGSLTSAVTTTFNTPCLPLGLEALPISDDFDDLDAPQHYDRPCWSTLNYYPSNQDYPMVSTTYANSGSQCLAFYPGHSNQPQYLVSPAIEEVNGLLVSFQYMASEYVDMTVGYMTNPTDTTTFVGLYTQRGAGNSATGWTSVEQAIVAPEGTRYIAIRMGTYTSYGFSAYIDDITIEELPFCFHPTSVSVDNIEDDAVSISWTTSGSEVEWAIYLNGALHGTSSTHTYTLTGLSHATNYTVGVASVCDEGDTTSAISTTFRTPCGSISLLPWTETFENVVDGSDNANSPDCWTIHYVNYNTSYFPYIVNMGSKTYVYRKGETAPVMVLPEFDEPMENLQISFLARLMEGPCYIEVGYVTDADDTTTFVSVATHQITEGTFTQFASAFPEGASGRIALRLDGDEGKGGWIDDIRVALNDGTVPIPTACDVPTGVHSTATTTTSITLDWGGTAASWKVSVDGGAEQAVSSHPYTLTGLAAGTAYSIRVKAVCDGGQESDYSAAVSVSTQSEQPGPVGIDGEAYSMMSLYPNPTSLSVTISGIEAGAQVSIVDMSGRTVRALTAQGSTTVVSLEGLASGTYFVRTVGAQGTATTRLLVR